jgi:CheY-like chemotaxis protein
MTPWTREKSACCAAKGTAAVNVLVVDDDEQFRALARGLLEPAGFEVSEAASIAECLAQMRSRAAAVIVLDILLPGGDGITALREIKELFPRTRIVTVSGAEESDLYLSVSAELGAHASLSKSSVSVLGALLRVVLERWLCRA